MGKGKQKYFVVWEGITPGIYSSWEECKRQVHGFQGAKYKSFTTMEEARQALSSPCWDYIGRKTDAPRKTVRATSLPEEVRESIAVDAACSGNPGTMEYQGVYTRTGERIFHQGPFRAATNNIGEFLAVVHALALLKQKGSSLPVYSDSHTARVWVRNKKVKTRLARTEANAAVFNLIERAEKWLQNNEHHNRVCCWETEQWGEIPADFGRK